MPEVRAEMTGNANLRCLAARQLITAVAEGLGLKNKKSLKFEGYPVIGYQNDMQASGYNLLQELLILSLTTSTKCIDAFRIVPECT